jgi:hypothetical protein
MDSRFRLVPQRLEAEADRSGYLPVFNIGPTGNLRFSVRL